MFANILLFHILWCSLFSFSEAATSGPFFSYVSSARICNKTSYPMHPSPSIEARIELYNATDGNAGIRGFVNVRKDTTGVKLKTKSLIWENGKWKTNFMVADSGCHGTLLPLLMTITNIKFDKDRCAFLKCQTAFNLPNTNKVHHFITNTAEYGTSVFISEMYIAGKQYKTLFCYEVVTIIEPI